MAAPEGTMMPLPTIYPPAMRQAMADRRLTLLDRHALLVLWHELSPAEYRPMKSEALASLLGVRRESAARALRRLLSTGYLTVTQPDPRAPRLFLLVNVVPIVVAADAAA